LKNKNNNVLYSSGAARDGAAKPEWAAERGHPFLAVSMKIDRSRWSRPFARYKTGSRPSWRHDCSASISHCAAVMLRTYRW
jgi:hypothetical protein